jgi:hypothetical protein
MDKRLAILLLLFVLVSCDANQGVLRAGRETPMRGMSPDERPQFAKDLDAMRTAGFTFIYELRRPDGKAIDADDIKLIKISTIDANRRVKTDDDRAVLIGSNFELSQENLAALYARFAVEDHSPAPATDMNANSTSAK